MAILVVSLAICGAAVYAHRDPAVAALSFAVGAAADLSFVAVVGAAVATLFLLLLIFHLLLLLLLLFLLLPLLLQ